MPARVVSEAKGDRTFGVVEIRRRATAMLACLQLEKLELSVLLTDDDQIQKLNKVYRAKDRPTDVLAFAMREGEHSALAGDLLGDVIISLPTAERQAREHGVPPLDEVTMLLAHGLLHLLGWDHETAKKDRAMRAEVERLVASARPRARKQTTLTARSGVSATPPRAQTRVASSGVRAPPPKRGATVTKNAPTQTQKKTSLRVKKTPKAPSPVSSKKRSILRLT